MKIHFAFAWSTAAVAALASAAPPADMPAAGEMPFALVSMAPSALTRAQVQAGAVAAPPRMGEAPYIEDSVPPSVLTRDQVAAEAIATPPAAGESYGFAAGALARGG